jgi:DNA-binding MurR/RpiR family transcriptional regulator
MPPAGSPQSRLVSLFGAQPLSPSHRRIARHLIDHAPDSVFLSSLALAAEVGVSQPSVTRFARALGFDGYTELQAHLRSLMVSSGTAAHRARPNVYQQAVREAIHTLEALDDHLAGAGDIAALGRHLARSDPLVVLSVRASAPAASYFAYYAARVHSQVRLLTAGGSAMLDGLGQARHGGGEWVLCFLLSRHPAEMLTALRFARDLGFRVATVTARSTAAVRDLSEVVLPAAVGTRLAFSTYAAPMVLAGVLLEAICQAAPKRSRARLDDHERMVAEHRIFLS